MVAGEAGVQLAARGVPTGCGCSAVASGTWKSRISGVFAPAMIESLL